MPKNIVICADGTGNTTVRGRGTNVFKLYEAIDQNGHRFDPTKIQQVAIYHDGVGTESLKWVRIFAGAFGWGLSRNVKQLYGELARVYDPGDRIYLFGFSRGAFTVRTLAGLVVTCGILDPDAYQSNRKFWGAVRAAYGEYRRKYQTSLSRLFRGQITIDPRTLRRRFSVPIPAFTDPTQKIIDFVGVWDTVDAVGAPFGLANLINSTFYRFKFPDTKLSDQVAYACHALAVDEERKSFTPLLWRQQPDDEARVEQVWFAGVHSNVGGGYPRQGLSLVTLDWMMRKGEERGLRFLDAHRLIYRDGADVDDKLYDPRAGLGVFYRWRPRNIEAICKEHHVVPKVHRTVYQRIARNTEGYAPGSLPPDSRIITTSSQAIAEPLRRLVAAHFGNKGPLMTRKRGSHLIGVVAYWLLMGTVLTLGGLIAWTYLADLRSDADWHTRFVHLAATIASSSWLGVTARTIWHYPWLPAASALSLLLSLRVDSDLTDRYSEFWHGLMGPMRDLLEKTDPRFGDAGDS
jgi:uncharacterized protein (DUF2235 family)